MKNKINFIELFWVFWVTWLVGSLWVMYAGKELSWDYFNHHMYIPFAWDTGRIHTDYFAAGPQSYQNPIGYFPFYWMVKFGLSDWLIGLLTTGLHAINGVVVWLLAKIYWQDGAEDRFYPAIAVAFAVTTPIYLVLLGSSSVDNTSSILVLLTLFFLQNKKIIPVYSSIMAGLCIGLACAIKLSNAYFLIAFIPVVLWQKLRHERTNFEVLAFILAAAASGMAGSAWWMLTMWEKFKNPIFPLYNNIFKSPFYNSEKLISNRFIVDDYFDVFYRFWEMTFLKSFVYFEGVLPDVRPVLMLLVVVFTLVASLLGQKILKKSILSKKITKQDVEVLIFVIVSYLLWVNSSGNARYAVTLLILFSVLFTRWVSIIFPKRNAMFFLGIIFCLQVSLYFSVSIHRFFDAPWSGQAYVKAIVPQKLQEKPYLHLAVGMLSYSSFAQLLHPDGAWSNPILSQIPLPVEGVAGKPLNDLLLKWEGKTRFLLPINDFDQKDKLVLNKIYSDLFYRFKLNVDWGDCVTISINHGQSIFKIKSEYYNSLESRNFQSCAASKINDTNTGYEQALKSANLIYDAIEKTCPNLYSPKPFVTEVESEISERTFVRRYSNSDIIVLVDEKNEAQVINSRNKKWFEIKNLRDAAKINCSLW